MSLLEYVLFSLDAAVQILYDVRYSAKAIGETTPEPLVRVSLDLGQYCQIVKVNSGQFWSPFTSTVDY